MAISSPAFERNGTIPAQYTCDGADVSPPLQWQHLPAHTKELVLFVIDDSSDGTEGGIRWIVAGIDPSLSGISAGQLPAGAVVGLNGSGKATYGGICPPKGKPASIEFVLWALSKTIPLSQRLHPVGRRARLQPQRARLRDDLRHLPAPLGQQVSPEPRSASSAPSSERPSTLMKTAAKPMPKTRNSRKHMPAPARCWSAIGESPNARGAWI